MDNQVTGSTGPLDSVQAAEALADYLEPQLEEEKKEAAEPEAAAPVEAVEPAEEEPTVTVKIDGKDVEVPLSELKNGYQRQADYTRKTMEAADTRKAAEAERAQLQQERQAYAQNLQRLQAQDEAALQQQQNIDWQALIDSDPVEYLKQQRTAQERHARLQQVYAEQQRISAMQQAEQEQMRSAYLAQQQDELLAKLPDWRDSAKATAEKTALRDYLLEAGYDDKTVSTITDAKAVLLARKAMLYDQMIGKAQTATKRVANLPQKVERPGQGENPGIDRRTAAYLKLNKSGRVEDAASVFASFI